MGAYDGLPDWMRDTANAYEARKRYDAELKAIHDRVAQARLARLRELAALRREAAA